VWHRFRGGKGVATAFGAILWMEPLVGLGLVAIWALFLAVTRVSSIGSLVATVLMVPGVALTAASAWSLVWVAAITVLVLFRHGENIRRLGRGEERSIRADAPPP
jgi:glycerol-3-phosphate acyltransferase PlsY